MYPSSTSSSSRLERWPLAPLLALLLVLAADELVLGESGPWKFFLERLELQPVRETRLEVGIASDHLELERLRGTPREQRARAIVIGNSRARVGLDFDPELLNSGGAPSDANLGLEVAHCSHAPISPWIMHSAAARFLECQPHLVVLLLSELDTHRQVNPVPAATFGDPATLGVLASGFADAGVASLWDRRLEWMQLALADGLRAYRYRPLLGHAGLAAWHRFETRSVALAPDSPERFPSSKASFDEPSDRLPELPDIEAIASAIRDEVGEVRPHTLRLVNNIRIGEHSALQERLVEDLVRRLRAAGVQVLIVEGPLNPAGYPLYDRDATRAEFLALAERLVREHGAHFLSLEESGPFPTRAFSDLLHLRPPGARALTRATLKKMLRILDLEEPQWLR